MIYDEAAHDRAISWFGLGFVLEGQTTAWHKPPSWHREASSDFVPQALVSSPWQSRSLPAPSSHSQKKGGVLLKLWGAPGTPEPFTSFSCPIKEAAKPPPLCGQAAISVLWVLRGPSKAVTPTRQFTFKGQTIRIESPGGVPIPNQIPWRAFPSCL